MSAAQSRNHVNPSDRQSAAADRRQATATRERSRETLPPYLRVVADGVHLSVKLQPRASINEVGEPLGPELRVKVTAPPVDAAANEALVRFLAAQLRCPRSAVSLERGHASRHKVVRVRGLTPTEILHGLGLEAR